MVFPWSLSQPSGASACLLAHAKALRGIGFTVDCLAPATRDTTGPVVEEQLASVFDRIYLPPREHPILGPALTLVGTLLADDALPEQCGRDASAMAAGGVLTHLSDYALVEVFYMRCHSIQRVLPPDVPAMVFALDLDSEVARQREAIFGTPATFTLRDEVQRFKPFDLVGVVGPADEALVRSADPTLRVVEVPSFAPDRIAETPPENVRCDVPRPTLVWISSNAPFSRMSFGWFWQHVWPRLGSARTSCELVVAGQISEFARQCGANGDPAVTVLGTVPDVSALYARAAVALAPYYYGAGIKIKVLEALAHGVPVVTTSPGLSNTRLVPGVDVTVADSGSAFADSIRTLLGSPSDRTRLAEAGLAYVRTWHNSSTAFAGYRRAVEEVVSRPRRVTHSRTSPESTGLAGHTLSAIERCRALGVGRVAVYGAGSHTQMLLPLWDDLGGPPVASVLVSARSPETLTAFGRRLLSLEEFDPKSVDAVVPSSMQFEAEMIDACTSRWPSLPVIPLWTHGTGLASLPPCLETIPK